MRFELFLAARYLRAKRRQAVVGVVTAISVAGVAAGVAALIIALAITNGMQHDLQDKLLGSTAHVDLMRVQADGIHDWRPLVERLRHVPHVVAVSPGIYEGVMVSHGPRSGFALIKGVLPAEERGVSNLLDSITTGSAEGLESGAPGASVAGSKVPDLVLGKDLAEQLGVQAGDQIMVTSPQGELNPVIGLVPTFRSFRVAGIFHSGFYQYDSGMAFTSLAVAQQLFDEPDVLSIISFKIDNPNDAPEVGRAIEQAAGQGFMTTILIALTMMVMEKTRDIAVMMSYGVDPGQIQRIFLLEGLLIAVVGTALGLVLGYLGAWAGGHYHFIHLSAEVYSIDTLPFEPRVMDAVIVSAVSIGMSLLATLYPSTAAARVMPAEALRYE
jgi:lipoprotein-releasing system permease protein